MKEEVEGSMYDQWDPRKSPRRTPGSDEPASADEADCPTCGGLRYIRRKETDDLDDPNFGQLDPCPDCLARAHKATAESLWKRANVPPKFQNNRFDNYRLDLFPMIRLKGAHRTQRESVQEALEEAERFARGDGPPFLTLLGAPGTGKTHLAASVIHAVSERLIASLYVPADELADKARSRERDTDFFSYTRIVPVLALDDVGAEYGSDYMTSVFHNIIDSRYRNPGLRTLLITNLTEADLTERLGVRVIDRLVENGTGVAVVIEAESVRPRRPI